MLVVPVLPGTITIGISLLVWAIALQNTVGWVVFAIGMVFVAAGMLASLVLTGRRLKQRQVPNWSILVAVLTGVVGMFVIPVVGLFHRLCGRPPAQRICPTAALRPGGRGQLGSAQGSGFRHAGGAGLRLRRRGRLGGWRAGAVRLEVSPA